MESLYSEMEKISVLGGVKGSEEINQMKEKLKEFSQSAQKQRATLMLADKYFNMIYFIKSLKNKFISVSV